MFLLYTFYVLRLSPYYAHFTEIFYLSKIILLGGSNVYPSDIIYAKVGDLRWFYKLAMGNAPYFVTPGLLYTYIRLNSHFSGYGLSIVCSGKLNLHFSGYWIECYLLPLATSWIVPLYAISESIGLQAGLCTVAFLSFN